MKHKEALQLVAVALKYNRSLSKITVAGTGAEIGPDLGLALKENAVLYSHIFPN
jgi:hypothetical protein